MVPDNVLLDRPTHKGIKWSEEIRDNITNVRGKVGNVLMFDIVRHKNDDWIMTSNVIPMDMIVLDDLDKCQIFALIKLMKFTAELCLSLDIKSDVIQSVNKDTPHIIVNK